MGYIGDIEIKGKVILGPMAGVTTLAYREFMKPFGVGLSYSEMISDCGISYGNKKTFAYAATSSLDRPVGLQIFGYDAETAKKAINWLEKNAEYDILDVNLGCPVYKVVKTGSGSAWLKRPEELYLYMKAIVEASSKPVTAKIRLGWDEDSINVREVAHLLEKAGVKMITVHARTSRQGYAGESRYELIKDLGDELSIPLCVSGDIDSVEAAAKAVEMTKASYVMVARGGVGNPRLVTNINRHFEGLDPLPEPTLAEQVAWAKEFASLLCKYEGEKVASMQLRGLIPHFFKGFPGYKKIRFEITQSVDSFDDLMKILNGIERRQNL